MDLGLKNKAVLITGGSKGIGLACAEEFLREGARLAIVSRSRDNLDAAASQLAALGPAPLLLQADTSDIEQAAAAVKRAHGELGTIDILVNSAGAARRTPPDELLPQAWQAAMQSKYFSYTNVIDPVIKIMARQGWGAIVNVVGAGGKVPMVTHLPGGAANAALMLITAGLANAYAGRGIRVNAVNPSATLTDRLYRGLEADARLHGISTEQALKNTHARLPQGRIAQPQEVANAVVFLACERASYINGIILTMDGAANPIVV